MKEITVEQFLKLEKAIAVDVRSPIEYRDGAIPGSISLPLFSDEERAQIGTLYKQEGENAAKWKAMEVVSPKIPFLMMEIKNLITNGHLPVIHCWRGGMRSKSVSSFMDYSGLSSVRLIGGYKAYREYTLEKIKEILPQKAIVIHGKTGVGKTEILHQLASKGYPTLDLEAMAGHRGSIFGAFGLGEGNNQKNFDALVFKALSKIKDYPYFIMEAESKRIGRVVQPEELLMAKKNGHHLYLEASINRRVEQIVREYVLPYSSQFWFKEKVQLALHKIDKRIKNSNILAEIDFYLSQENWEPLIKILLEEYYDPRYEFKRTEYNGTFEKIDAEDYGHAVDEIEKAIGSIDMNSNCTVRMV